MDNDIRRALAPTPTARGNAPALAGGTTPMDDEAARIETHWSRILYYDLFAPAQRGSRGGADDSASDD